MDYSTKDQYDKGYKDVNEWKRPSEIQKVLP